MARIRTLEFLPEVFQTPTNSQFLSATLDQLVNPPVTSKIQGYIGSRFGYGVNANDKYVVEPTKVRKDYQLDPGVVFTKPDEMTAKDFITYPGLLDALENQGAVIDDNNKLFTSQFYSWDPFINLDPLINYNQYYWAPEGLPAVNISTANVYLNTDYVVTSETNDYVIRAIDSAASEINPTLTLLRGGTYRFIVDQPSKFWIQGQPGTSGTSITQPNFSVRLNEQNGVFNNGAQTGVVTFTVPAADAQNEFIFPASTNIGVVCNRPFANINGQLLSTVANIDGVTSLDGLTVMFYNTGVSGEIAYTSAYYDEENYDTNNNTIVAPLTINVTSTTSGTNTLTCSSTSNLQENNAVTFTGTTFGGINTYSATLPDSIYYVKQIIGPTQFTVSLTIGGPAVTLSNAFGNMTANINTGLFEEGFYSDVNNYFYTISYVGDPDNPVLRLTPTSLIPINVKIVPNFGIQYNNIGFYKNVSGIISQIPYITAPLNTLYYQDGLSANKVGVLKIVDSNNSNTLNIETDILGKTNFSINIPNGQTVNFTNGLKVSFSGDVIPASYLEGEYYVQGVGTAIELVNVANLTVPEGYTVSEPIPYDIFPYDIGNFDASFNVPVTKDYITIARNSLSYNAWSRSNRWFHSDVINATAIYLNNPSIVTTFANEKQKANRPIVEFYPNLKLFNQGTIGKSPVDFIDRRTTDAFSAVNGQIIYYPDVEVYTNYTGTINTCPTGVASSNLIIGQTYIIAVLGTTDWNKVAGTTGVTYNVGDKIVVVDTDSGNGSADAKSYTTVTIALSDVKTVDENGLSAQGTFQLGQYINDIADFSAPSALPPILPNTARILSITGTSTLTLTVDWTGDHIIVAGTNRSFVADDYTNENYAIFDQARIIFAADSQLENRNKIYVASIQKLTEGGTPVIILSEAGDGQVLSDDQSVILRGYFGKGKTFYFDGEFWNNGQQKLDVNQAPLFDVFDDVGISFGNKVYYQGTDFKGNKLFAYEFGTGGDDPVLGFPLAYSALTNVGDISFDVAFNSGTFNYVNVTTGSPIVKNVNTGYVYNYTNRVDYQRLIGWQTAIAPSVQYQLFEFNWSANNPVTSFTCDIAANVQETDNWPVILVAINNKPVNQANYTYTTTANTTTVLLNVDSLVDTKVEISLLSDQVSQTAYYSIPVNLNNNPFNEDVTKVNIGDIRRQYTSIFYNNPNLVGTLFGSNNYRDLGNLVPWGDKIIQNSASLVAPGAFNRLESNSVFDALLFNSREYVKFKTLLVDTVNNSEYLQHYQPSYILDNALEQITSSKNQEQSFFWSDMLPSKAPYVSNSYTFKNFLDTSFFPLSRTYDYSSANYYGVLVYLQRTVEGFTYTTQLIKDVDYTISSTSPLIKITKDLQIGDILTINEYNQTYGSYVPNTPTKLGMYPSTVPAVVLDSQYTIPTYFIVGHDGSYNKLYGEYNPTTGTLQDYRDQILLEFEKRIYNNLKLEGLISPISQFDFVPGAFRTTDFTYDQWLEMYSTQFLDWIGQNRLDYKIQVYNKSNPFTYNWSNSQSKLDKSVIQQGYWRGLYQYYYDTTTPNTTPWEMLGYTNQPDWWTERYGAAPYTSDNTVLWNDLEYGISWNGSLEASQIIPGAARPGLSNVIPVDETGRLLQPWNCIVGNYNANIFQRDWQVGDVGPVELSYRRSSTYPFDFVRIYALMNPAKFFNLCIDLDNYRYNSEFNQYLVDNRYHLIVDNVEIYGNGTAKTSYINWIVDYQKQQGVNATANITSLLYNLDVRLVYRVAGFSDKTLLKFFVEKAAPQATNTSLLIPDGSFAVLLYENQPFDKLIYTSIIVQITNDGYKVFGNSQKNAYFKVLKPIINTDKKTISVEKLSVIVATAYEPTVEIIPYGTTFYNVQELAQFVMSYGAWTESIGAVYDSQINGIEVNWTSMVNEFLYWAQAGWEVGSTMNLNPAGLTLTINKESSVVQPLTIQKENFVLNQNLYPIPLSDLSIERDDTKFNVTPLNEGDAISYGQFNISNIEHGIVFDNLTEFNDVIYNLVTGLRQNRIYVIGTKTAEWNGTLFASGFIYNQDNIQEWNKNVKYTKGQIVKYKNKYWTALKVLQPSLVFQEQFWVVTDYNEVQKGLLPNSSTRSYESTLYYNVDKVNLESEADLLSFSLIGFRPRDYMRVADLTDITQVNVFKNLIRNKGTKNSVDAFKGANLPQGGIQYETYENWGILSGTFGGILNDNFVELRLEQSKLTGNPATVSLTDGYNTPNMQQYVPLNKLFNYSTPVLNPDILPTTKYAPSVVYPDAGYVNFNDVKMSAFYYTQLPSAVNQQGNIIPIEQFYVRDYVWIANYLAKWNVYTPDILNTGYNYSSPPVNVINLRSNLNGTATITFNGVHNLTKYDLIAIINFSANANGYYVVADILSPKQIIVAYNSNTAVNLTGQGTCLKFVSQRVDKPSDINNLPLLSSEFTKNTVWVDENNDGAWAVYRKSINYQYEYELNKTDSQTYGSSVAYGDNIGYIVSDAGKGEVYQYYTVDGNLQLYQTITGNTGFGSAIAHNDKYVVISQPTVSPTVNIYVWNDTILTKNILFTQTIPAPIGVTNWGSAVSISNDGRWIFVSDTGNNRVYIYRQQNIELTAGYFTIGETYTITELGTTDFTAIGAIKNQVGLTFVATGIGSGTGLATQVSYKFDTFITTSPIAVGDNFGASLATDYNGDVLVVGAPNVDYSVNTQDWGKTYIYQRITQNFEAPYSTNVNTPQIFEMAAAPLNTQISVTDVYANSAIQVASTATFNVNDPVIIIGDDLFGTGVQGNKIYYIESLPGSNTIKLKTSRSSTTAETFTAKAGIIGVNATSQLVPLYVSLNGMILQDNNYAVVGNNFIYTNALTAGDIINVGTGIFVKSEQLSSSGSPRVGVRFGNSVDITSQGTEIIVGAPYELNSQNYEGAVHRFTNGGAKYGIVTGTSEVNVTTERNLLINGFLVVIPAGNAASVASAINAAKITNVQANASNNILSISLINFNLAEVNHELELAVTDITTWSELGMQLYTPTQVITCPHPGTQTQFGSVVKFNEQNSFVASSPVSTRFAATTFDFSDDENQSDDTIFDNNSTRWVDTFPHAGAVYMFDYLSVYNESLVNSGAYVYAQSVNARDIYYGDQPKYGQALEFNNNKVLVGAPYYRPEDIDGQVIIYDNATGIQNWSVYRSSAPIIDTSRINNIQIFSAQTNNTLVNLDYIDPLQGKIFGAVRQNIDFVSNEDPASYNNGATIDNAVTWGASKVGSMWFDTSATRFVNYHQNDPVYNANYWAATFPGSNPAIYTWVASPNPPIQYTGPGVVRNSALYNVQSSINQTGIVQPVYYFWVRNTNTVNTQVGKTLSDTVMEYYINNPQASGIAYLSPILPNSFALVNCNSFINANDSVLHIGYSNTTGESLPHQEYSLIRANYADDFLTGVPNGTTVLRPEGLYGKLLDSFAGVDEQGSVVPNPFLPIAVQSGVLARPRQTFFYNRFKALENYIQYANAVMKQYPIVELRPNISFLSTVSEIPTSEFVNRIDWWAPGFDNSVKPAYQVAIYSDLLRLSVPVSTIARVVNGAGGNSETYQFQELTNPTSNVTYNEWIRIGLTNGTYQISSTLYDYNAGKFGFDGNFFDTFPFDTYPSAATRSIIRAINEQIFIEELLIERNKLLILMFEYITSETNQSQNYLPWLTKTSLLDVKHTIRELLPTEKYRSDSEEFLSGYLNEVKPYHVVIKEFLLNYTGSEFYQGNVTDFDLPAQFDTATNSFQSPELIYGGIKQNQNNQYLSESAIWQTQPYADWYTNYGVSLTGQNNYLITELADYVAPGSTFILVKNISGFPVAGTIRIDDEVITYSSIDPALHMLKGLVRGANNTDIAPHLPRSPIFIDLPSVIVLDSGSQYTEPPKVTAYIDPILYPNYPRELAQLEPIMSLNKVIGVNVINPGSGYPVLPEIIIEPSIKLSFNSTAVNSTLHTIELSGFALLTGNLIRYYAGTGTAINYLQDKQWYYVNVLDNDPVPVIALYTTYADAINDENRVPITVSGTSTGNQLWLGAKASAITSSQPIRENIITMKFDRNSYTSKVTDWKADSFYGSFFAGDYESQSASSWSLLLYATQPNINNILSSAEGFVFPIVDVQNHATTIWSVFERSVNNFTDDIITLQLFAPASETTSGSTIGFYIGMPIKFTGPVATAGITANTEYYVSEIVSETEFKISATIGGGSISFTTFTISNTPVNCYTGYISNVAELTTIYQGIRNVTASSSITNAFTIPLSEIGTGGTQGLYIGAPVTFTFNAIGGVRQNQVYYVYSIIDLESFTIAEEPDSTSPVSLTTETGNATMTIGLPVSPGQVDGQLFTCYQTSQVYGPLVPTYLNNLLTRTVDKSLTGSNILTLSKLGLGTDNMYVNMTFTLDNNLGGLIAGDEYVVESLGTVSITCTSSGSGTFINCNSTYNLYNNMPVVFSGSSLGTIILGKTYYVIVTGSAPYTSFQVAQTIGGSAISIGNDTGIMIGTGPDYITVTDEPGNPAISLTTGTGPVTLTQKNNFIDAPPVFVVQSILGGYSVGISDSGSQFAIGNELVILGENLGGTTPENNCTLTVNSITDSGEITSVIVNGNVPTQQNKYFVKITGANTFVLFEDPLYQIPVSGINFPYTGFSSTTVTGSDEPSKTFTVADTSIFVEGDPVVFTGNIFGGIVLGQVYYIADIVNSTTIQIADVLGQTILIPTETTTGAMTMAKAGSYMLLPEPFYFQPSIVKYNNRVYKCAVSNNDKEFIFGKWIELNPADPELNALDRAIGYYNPTANMPGVDLPQLFTGLEYPNATYLGQQFEPNSLLPLDVIIKDQPFEQKNINFPAIGYVDTKYILPANLPTYSALVTNLTSNRWNVGRISQTPLNLTDFLATDDTYILTSSNTATPIIRSNDGVIWATNGLDNYSTSSTTTLGIGVGIKQLIVGTALAYVPDQTIVISHDLTNEMTGKVVSYDSNTGYLTVNILTTTGSGTYNAWEINPEGVGIVVNTPPCSIQKVAYYNNIYVAVGDKIISSDDSYTWIARKLFDSTSQVTLYSVIGVNIPGFNGFVAVGKGLRTIFNPNENYISTAVVLTSIDGYDWVEISGDNIVGSLTTQGFKAISSDGTKLVATGENGVVYISYDAQTWFGINESEVTGYGNTDELSVKSLVGFDIDDPIRFTESFDVLDSNTTYYIRNISGFNVSFRNEYGIPIALSYSGLPDLPCFMYKYPSTATINDIIYSGTQFVAVGDEGLIVTSPDGIIWTEQTSGTTEDLSAVAYINNISTYALGGNNNTFLQSLDAISWYDEQKFLVAAPEYTVTGGPFLQGYGPEELVPGNVLDGLQLIVNTRPGSNWPVTQYSHNGYDVASYVYDPDSSTQTDYRFNINPITKQKLVTVPAQISVFKIDSTSGKSVTLYEGLSRDYIVDWVNQIVVLNTPLDYILGEKLRVDVYAVGNGLQIVQSSTENDPYISNITTGGFDQIPLACNYSAGIEQGNGAIRPDFVPIEVIATATSAITNLIYVENTSNFVVSSPITFAGNVFGNITADTVYYVKTVNPSNNTITVSTSLVNNVPGQTFVLTSDTGSMTVIVQVGNGLYWTDPIVMKNGKRLSHGSSLYVSQTKADTNSLVCNTISGLIIGDPVTFDDAITDICPNIDPHKQYNIYSFVDPNEFTIEDPLNPGLPVILTNGYGRSQFIQNDYAIVLAQNGINAELILAEHLIDGVDYVSYSIFGELEPSSLGYTLPETQVFNSNGTTYSLNNAVGGVNPENAIVEVDGIRVDIGDYLIDPISEQLSFGTDPGGNTIAITTFNNTEYQYFNTQWNPSEYVGETYIVGDTTHYIIGFDELGFDSVPFNETENYLTLKSPYTTANLTVGQSVEFGNPTIGTISTTKKYFIKEIKSGTEFTISRSLNGTVDTITTDSGDMPMYTYTYNVANIINVDNTIHPSIYTNVISTSGSNNEILCDFVQSFWSGLPVQFQTNRIPPDQIITGIVYRIESLGDTDWNAIGYVGTPTVGTTFIATGSGTGSGIAMQALYGDLDTTGEVYIVDVVDIVNNTITVKDAEGNPVTLVNQTGQIKAKISGTTAVTITTGIPHLFVTNDLVQIDGLRGSTQLNNNQYYVHVINNYQFEIYLTPYDPAYNAPDNNPVLTVSAYQGGGFTWIYGIFVIQDTFATATSSVDNKITVASVDTLIIDTPVYFNKFQANVGDDIMGNLIYGKEYYIKDIDTGTNQITVSEVRGGAAITLSSDTGSIGVSQWQQDNVDRLWVTVNGYRVPSTSLRLNPYNQLSILSPIVQGDSVVITSMTPAETPAEERYINFVSTRGEGSVYRANTQNRTWLTHELNEYSTTISVADITHLTNVTIQNSLAPAPINGYMDIGLNVNKNDILQVIVYNKTKELFLSVGQYQVVLEATAPVLHIKYKSLTIQTNDELEITVVLGNLIMINGEQIRLGGADLETNTLIIAQRGANGTGVQKAHPKYSTVYGLMSTDKMTVADYGLTWNPIPGVYNETEGDPLQLSNTFPAIFLKTDIT